MEWVVDKSSKMPLYLQLKDFIKYSISTGAIQYGQRLPTVHGLAQQVGVNFETVRKAYKDLEGEGLVSTDRGRGTFVKGHAASRLPAESGTSEDGDPVRNLQHSIRRLRRMGKTAAQIKALVAEALDRSSHEEKKTVLFVECNAVQAQEISVVLRNYLDVNVKPVLLGELRAEVNRLHGRNGELSTVLTTGFHMSEVLSILGDRKVTVDFVMTNMSPETRRKLDGFPKNKRFGFICRDLDSKDLYTSSLKAELGIKSEIVSCLISETDKVAQILKTVDVLLAPPSIHDIIKKMAPSGLPVFNIQDRVDPVSLGMLKNRLAATLTAEPRRPIAKQSFA